jgi:hypothetical protein
VSGFLLGEAIVLRVEGMLRNRKAGPAYIDRGGTASSLSWST